MISSAGGKNATPFIGAYNASKFALEGLSEALRRELMLFGIDVIVVAPGPVVTAIWDKAMAEDFTPFAATAYAPAMMKAREFMIALGRRGLSSEHLGRSIHHALTAARPRVRYSVTPQPVLTFVFNALPKRVADRLLAGRLGLLQGRQSAKADQRRSS
jgi:short-subunit dehydrogenase